MRNTVSSLIMLSAGLISVLCCIILRYNLETTLIIVVTVLFVFMIIGFIAQKIISNMTKEAEERFRQEEARRREEEAAAQAEAEAAAQAALEAETVTSEETEILSPDTYINESVEITQE